MKTGLLLSAAEVVVGVAVGGMVGGAVDVQAACVPIVRHSGINILQPNARMASPALLIRQSSFVLNRKFVTILLQLRHVHLNARASVRRLA